MDSRAWDERYAAVELVWGQEPNRWVTRETAELPPGRALDVAAGEGRNAIWLARRGWRVTAVDFSAIALDRGRALAADMPQESADRISWVRADVRTYAPPPREFDLVLVAYLHLPGDARGDVWRRAADATAPGGTLLIVGHDATNLTDGTGGPRDPDVLYTPDEVLTELTDASFDVVRAEQVRRPVAVPDADPVDAIDALVRLRRAAAT